MSISYDEIIKIISLYKSNFSLREIKKITGKTVPYLSRLLKEQGIEIKKYNKLIKSKKQEEFQLKEIDKKTELKVIDSYQDGEMILTISKKYKIAISQVRSIIYKKNKLKRKNYAPVSNILNANAFNIINDYNSGTPISKISKNNNVNDWSIKKILLNNGIILRENVQRKYTFNENFFFEKTPELYYFMGFCLADGSIWQNKTNKQFTLSICIHEKDISILNNFCSWLNIDPNAIKTIKRKNQKKLSIHSQNLFKDGYVFSDFGVVPNKTYFPSMPKIDKECLKPFIMGLMDGDGHITYNFKKKYHFDLVCNKQIINWYISSLRELGFKGKITEIMPEGKVWGRAIISIKDDIRNLFEIFNIEECSFVLERKWKW